MTVREIPAEYCAVIRESANRPHLLLGCEPWLVALACLLTAVWVISFLSILGFLTGGMLFFFSIQLFRQMAKKDPYWVRIWLDGKRWLQGYWPAQSARPRVGNWRPLHKRRMAHLRRTI
jgi:type IV secretory pathway TrbD component